MGIFSGLESFGLSKLKNVDIYENSSNNENASKNVEKSEKPKIIEADILFDKTYTCPVCDSEFKAKNHSDWKGKAYIRRYRFKTKVSTCRCIEV